MFKTFQRLCSTTKGWTLDSTVKETNILSIRSLKDQTKLQFPLVWLRDNCLCSNCFNKTSKSRILDLRTNLKVKPLHVQLEQLTGNIHVEQPSGNIDLQRKDQTTDITRATTTKSIVYSKIIYSNEVQNTSYNTEYNESKHNAHGSRTETDTEIDKEDLSVANETVSYKLNIQWEDGHESDFTLDWLLTRNFSDDNRRKLSEVYKMTQIPWVSDEFESICSRFDYDDIIRNKKSLLRWMECLATYGVAIVENAGSQIGSLKELASKVGFLKKTQYGETFRVEAKPGTSNVAYLSSKLQLHTDLPYYEYKPGLNMLHCIVQSKGSGDGMNQLADCLAVCQYLSTNQRHEFDILTRTLVDWSDYGEDDRYKFANIHRAPIICLDTTGRITRINYSQPQRDSVFNVPLAEVEPWYDAMAKFTELLHDPKYMVELKLQTGDVLTFDNTRLVHGRSGYDGERLLEGGYLDWDLVRSRIRVLREELGDTVECS